MYTNVRKKKLYKLIWKTNAFIFSNLHEKNTATLWVTLKQMLNKWGVCLIPSLPRSLRTAADAHSV